MDSSQLPARHARSACFSCRHSKRRCDKSLPVCRLCVRKGIECCYPTRRAQRYVVLPEGFDTTKDSLSERGNSSTNEAAHSSSSGSLEGESPLEISQASKATLQSFAAVTAIQFIAPDIFHDAHLEIPRINIAIPRDVAAHTGDLGQIRKISATFFSQAVIWTPVIFRKNFFNITLNPLSSQRTEGILLSLCMKLYCTPVVQDEEDGKTALYKTAKEFYSRVETSGIMSICILQSAILIAVYEIGHAIYPAAYLTVGACARYGIALGLDKVMADLMGEGNLGKSWMEIEEMRRVWWGILILDRYVVRHLEGLCEDLGIVPPNRTHIANKQCSFLNLGNPTRCLTTKDPEYDDYLPVDDRAFLNAVRIPLIYASCENHH